MESSVSVGLNVGLDVGAGITAVLESVFAEVERVRTASAELLARHARPELGQLASLRRLLCEQLDAHPLLAGTGFVAAPGLLADVPSGLEWWVRGADGAPAPLHLDLDPTTSAYADYTHWDWYTVPRDSGERAVTGPYVDYLCTDEYSLTLAAPVQAADGSFAGVAGADVYLRDFEAAVLPLLRASGAPCCLVNSRNRVVASTSVSVPAGTILRDHAPGHPTAGLQLVQLP